MSTNEHKATVRRAIEESFNRGNLSVIDELYATDYVGRDPANPDITDRAGTRQFVAEVLSAKPDAAVTIEDQIAEGDRVVSRYTFRGTNTGAFPDQEPTGKPVVITGIIISRLQDGKIVEEWAEWDAVGLQRQPGLP